MNFLYPYNLTLLLLIVLFYIYLKKNQKNMVSIFDKSTLNRLFNRDKFLNYRLFTLFFALSLLIIALARPVLEKEKKEIKIEGFDIAIAIDLSASMSATDFKPNRFELAKKKLKEFINFNIKNRYAIIGFTTNALILSPLNSDRELLYYLFDSINLDNVVSKGTKFMPILEKTKKLIKTKDKILIIFSDGGDESNFNSEIEFAKKNNIKVFMLGLATKEGTTLKDKNSNLLLDKDKNLVVSSLNKNIEDLTNSTGGKLIQVTKNSKFDIKTLHSKIEEISKKRKFKKNNIYEYKELFYYFILISIVLFFLAIFGRKK